MSECFARESLEKAAKPKKNDENIARSLSSLNIKFKSHNGTKQETNKSRKLISRNISSSPLPTSCLGALIKVNPKPTLQNVCSQMSWSFED